jgi:membrane-bound serine protease (ClpP class)
MVDSDVELYTRTTDSGVEILERLGDEEEVPEGELLIAKGKLLTLSAEETLRVGLAEHEASRIGSVTSLYNLGGARIERVQLNWSEVVARFLTHPFVSGMLLTFGFLGILYELKIPGWGISGTIGLICLGLFFGAHLLVGLAQWMELLLFALGIALLVAEIFFIPGFGVAGISGIVCLLLAIYLALVKTPIPTYSWEYEQFRRAMYTVAWVMVGIPVTLALTWKLLPHTPFYARIVQVAEERSDLGFTAESTDSYMGKTGRTVTILRPAGRARFEGRLVDVVAEGEFIPPNTKVKVIDVKGNRVVVVPEEEVEKS